MSDFTEPKCTEINNCQMCPIWWQAGHSDPLSDNPGDDDQKVNQ